ncbi:MAG: GIY-YIG nuclease family protein [Pseudolabrys sp.]|jgi:Uri superfamily endonuclease
MDDTAPTAGSFCTCADAVPAAPGAYILAVELAEALTLALPGKPAATLGPGRYLYCGSARGPGGLRARLRRHMARGKAIRWHIDNLSETGTVLGTWVFPDESECELAGRLASLPVPIAGFGSTDCRRCHSHLFRWAGAAMPAVALRARGRKDTHAQ